MSIKWKEMNTMKTLLLSIAVLAASCTGDYAHLYAEGAARDQALARVPAVEFSRDLAVLEYYTRAGAGELRLPFLRNDVAPQAFAYMPGRVQFVDLVLSSDSEWAGRWRGDANAIAVVYQAGDVMPVSTWYPVPPQGPPPDGLPVLQKREVLEREGSYMSWSDALRRGLVRCGVYDRDAGLMEYNGPERCVELRVHPDIRWVIRDRGPVLVRGEVERDMRALLASYIREFAW